MDSFRHLAAPLRIHHGPDSLAALPSELDRVGARRAVVVCGATLARSDALQGLCAAAGDRIAGVFGQVAGHSPLPVVEAAAAALRDAGADAVIAVGGGSAIVTARAASILLAEQRDAHALCTARAADGRLHSPKLPAPKLPQFVVPTTPTTASVKAGSAVLDPATHGRLALFDPKTRAQAVFVHPQMLATAPRPLTLGAGLHTLVMAVEGLLSPTGDAISDALLVHAVRMMAAALPDLAAAGTDIGAGRASLAMAALMCGHATDFTGAGIALPLGHAISASADVDNGVVNAILAPHVLRFNAEAASAGVAKLALALQVAAPAGADALPTLVAALEDLVARTGVPRRLREIGVEREALQQLADVAMDDWFIKGNPRPVRDAAQLREVLAAAW